MRKSKIIATVGPVSFDKKVLFKMVKNGVDAFRFNFSHGTYEEKTKTIKIIREIEKQTNQFIPIIGDLQGPVIRLGTIKPLPVKRGDKVYIIHSEKGDAEKKEIPIPNTDLYDMLEEDDLLLIASGRIIIRIEDTLADKIQGSVLLDGTIKSEKTLAIKGKDIPLPTLNEKDIQDTEYIVEHDFDYIGLSFTRKPKDVQELRDLLDDLKAPDIKIISKIETKSAVEQIRNIIKLSDAILVARGDLAIYFDLQQIPKIQEDIVRNSRALGKPVIVATQILESMTENPMPTRAEVVDVANAVREGVDALMLAGETAIGKYPVESVAWLNKIIRESEKGSFIEIEPEEETIYDNFAQGIVDMAAQLEAKIAAYTRSGATGFRLARYRPIKQIYTFTPVEKVARQLRLLWGTKAYLLEEMEPQEAFSEIIHFLKKQKELNYGDVVILTAGMTIGTTDTIRIERISRK